MPFTKRTKKAIRRLFRDVIASKSYGSTTVENAGYRRQLDAAWRNGKIGVITSSIDCDCTRGYYERVVEMPNSVHALKRYADSFYDGLEGPGTMTFVPPQQIDSRRSHTRDLALEAFENGHPHVVYA